MALRQSMQRFFWAWVSRRAPRAVQVKLRHRSIYVLPNRAGVGFFVTVFLLWLLGTNYQNNLVLAASFLLLSLFFVSVVHAFRNLSGLQVKALGGAPVFAGDSVGLVLSLTPAPRSRHIALNLQLADGPVVACDIAHFNACEITVTDQAMQRGWYYPERILISSRFPLGVIRAWSWVLLDTRILVYPKPLPVLRSLNERGSGDDEELEGSTARIGVFDDFHGFVRYQPGAPQSQIAWKQYARGAGLHLKEYAGSLADSAWLDFDQLSGDTEQRLSGLCYLALEWHKLQREFGLRLPGFEITPESGDTHLQQVLQALALHDLPEAQ
ncbi:MAG TPA: DUF58 domain-containing protein [Cellvibrionaceae bacterium]